MSEPSMTASKANKTWTEFASDTSPVRNSRLRGYRPRGGKATMDTVMCEGAEIGRRIGGEAAIERSCGVSKELAEREKKEYLSRWYILEGMRREMKGRLLDYEGNAEVLN